MNFRFGLVKGRFTRGRDRVETAHGFTHTFLAGLKVAFSLETMKHGIERPRANLIAMAAQFLHDPNATDDLFRGVMEDVKPHQAGVKALVIHGRELFRPWTLPIQPHVRIAGRAAINQPPSAVRTTTNHGGTFQKTSRVNAAIASAKSAGTRIALVHTGL